MLKIKAFEQFIAPFLREMSIKEKKELRNKKLEKINKTYDAK